MARSGQKIDLRGRLRTTQARPPLAAPVDSLGLSWMRVQLIDDTLLSRSLKAFFDGEPAVTVDVRPTPDGKNFRFVWPVRDEYEGEHSYVRQFAAVETARYFLQQSMLGGQLRLYDDQQTSPVETETVAGRLDRSQPVSVEVDPQDSTNVLLGDQPLGTLPEKAAFEIQRRLEHGQLSCKVVLEDGHLFILTARADNGQQA